jgi:hypothetical protein
VLTSVADPNFFHPRSRVKKIPEPRVKKITGIRIRICTKKFTYFNTKIVSKLLEILSGMFIPDMNLDFLPGFRGQKGTG